MSFEDIGYRIDCRIDNWRYKTWHLVNKILGRKPQPWLAGSLLEVSTITKEALTLFKNSNAFMASFDDDKGSKRMADNALNIRLPADYAVALDARS